MRVLYMLNKAFVSFSNLILWKLLVWGDNYDNQYICWEKSLQIQFSFGL